MQYSVNLLFTESWENGNVCSWSFVNVFAHNMQFIFDEISHECINIEHSHINSVSLI